MRTAAGRPVAMQGQRTVVTFETAARICPNEAVATKISRLYDLDAVDYHAIREDTEEHLAVSAKILGNNLGERPEKALEMHMQCIVDSFVRSAHGAGKAAAARNASSAIGNENRQGIDGLQNRAQRACEFAAVVGLRAYAVLAAAHACTAPVSAATSVRQRSPSPCMSCTSSDIYCTSSIVLTTCRAATPDGVDFAASSGTIAPADGIGLIGTAGGATTSGAASGRPASAAGAAVVHSGAGGSRTVAKAVAGTAAVGVGASGSGGLMDGTTAAVACSGTGTASTAADGTAGTGSAASGPDGLASKAGPPATYSGTGTASPATAECSEANGGGPVNAGLSAKGAASATEAGTVDGGSAATGCGAGTPAVASSPGGKDSAWSGAIRAATFAAKSTRG